MSRNKKKKKISVNKIEHTVAHLLDNMNLLYERQVQLDKYTVDFLVHGKYIIECYGDYWHCNPLLYTSSYYNKGKKKTADEIWKRDECRRLTFEALGFKFLSLWEGEIRNNHKSIRQKIKRFTNE
jgi:very-short-patch-repair endonuclease